MKVQGRDITPEQIEACLQRMRAAPFEAFQISHVAYESGVKPGDVAARLADRLIQRERKAGTIVRSHLLWRPAQRTNAVAKET